MVLLIAYFSLVAIIGFVVIIISLVAAKVKKAESRLILDEGKPAEDKSINWFEYERCIHIIRNKEIDFIVKKNQNYLEN